MHYILLLKVEYKNVNAFSYSQCFTLSEPSFFFLASCVQTGSLLSGLPGSLANGGHRERGRCGERSRYFSLDFVPAS